MDNHIQKTYHVCHSKFVNKPNKYIVEVYNKILDLHENFQVVIAGGYATYLFGHTKSYGDVDIFLSNGGKFKRPSIQKLNDTTGLKWTSKYTNSHYPTSVYNAMYKNHNIQIIYLNYSTVKKLLLGFDLLICANAFWKVSSKTSQFKTLSLFDDNSFNFTKFESMVIPLNKLVKLDEKRVLKYKEREVVPSLQSICFRLKNVFNNKV